MEITFDIQRWELSQPLEIAGFRIAHLDIVYTTVRDGASYGRGEGVLPVVFDVSLGSVTAELTFAQRSVAAGANARAVCDAMAPGPARNSLDCALWDLDAKSSGRSAWEIAGLDYRPDHLEIDLTIGLASPERMAAQARQAPQKLLKIKLDQDLVLERLSAVRAARPDATLLADANQSWTWALLQRHAKAIADLGVSMIEQPLPVGEDEYLRGARFPFAIFADEACHTLSDLPRMIGLYQGVNIKLDKTGGLSEALRLAHAAKSAGLGIMAGCMAGTSLSMAPAYMIGSLADWVDLDGPLLLAEDRPNAMKYGEDNVEKFAPDLWG